LACVNQTSIWETCKGTDGTPCDDTTLTWLHTLNRHWLEVVANLLLGRLAMTILDPVPLDYQRAFPVFFGDLLNSSAANLELLSNELCVHSMINNPLTYPGDIVLIQFHLTRSVVWEIVLTKSLAYTTSEQKP